MKKQALTIEIRTRNFALTEAIRCHIIWRLEFALDRFGGRVQQAKVFIGNLNGPKGGHDKYCRIVLNLATETAVVEETHSDLYRAITCAARNAGASIARTVRRANRAALAQRSLLVGEI